jgi:hypothetical protein
MNEADIVLRDVRNDILCFYFFEGTDILGIAVCYNFKQNEPWESTVQYSDNQAFREEIVDMMDSGHYEIAQDKLDRIVGKEGESWQVRSEIETLQHQKNKLLDSTSAIKSSIG